jgi:hypothetical protein
VCTETRFICVNAPTRELQKRCNYKLTHKHCHSKRCSFSLAVCMCALLLRCYTQCVAFFILCCPSAVIINNPAASIAFEWKENTRRRFGWQNNRVGRICTLCSVCALGRVNESEPASGLLCTHIAHVAAGRTLCWLPVRRRQL